MTNTLELEAFPIFSNNDKEILFAAEEDPGSQDMDIKSVNIASGQVSTVVKAAGHQYSPTFRIVVACTFYQSMKGLVTCLP